LFFIVFLLFFKKGIINTNLNDKFKQKKNKYKKLFKKTMKNSTKKEYFRGGGNQKKKFFIFRNFKIQLFNFKN